MRKNRALLLAVVLILVVAISATVLVGCTVEKTKVTINAGNNNTGKTFILNQANQYISFAVSSEKMSVEGLVSVTDSSSNAVDVLVVREGNVYAVKAPSGGYTMGKIYTITVNDGVSFVDYAEYTSIKFTITSDSYSDIVLKSGVVQYSSDAVKSLGAEVKDGSGVINRTITLDTRGVLLEKDSVFTIYSEADQEQRAYKVVTCDPISGQPSLCSILATNPEVEEVFSTFEYHEKEDIEEEKIEFIVEETEQELNQSTLAQDILTFFGTKPTFNVDAAIADGVITVTVTVTVPNVVSVQGVGATNLVITMKNELSAESVSDINIRNLKEELADKEFNFFAKINNKMTTTVSLGTTASVDSITNIRDIITALQEVTESTQEEATSVPIFVWTIPIGQGAATISYKADLVFRFSFAGSLDLEAVSNMSYECGVLYTQADGLTPYQSQFTYSTDSVNLKMSGKVGIKVGVSQTLSLDVMGVLGVGITAELGNFNNLYGQVETTNLVAENPTVVGAVYFEGGFYYDVDLSFGLKIGTLIDLSKSVDIAQGEIVMYDLGERYYDTGVSNISGAQPSKIDMTASEIEIPTVYTRMFDLKANNYENVAIDVEELTYETQSENFTASNNKIALTPLANASFNENVIVVYNGERIVIPVIFNAANPILNVGSLNVNKDNVESVNNETITVTYASAAEVTVEGIKAVVSDKTVTIDKYDLLRLPTGETNVTIKVTPNGGAAIDLPLVIKAKGSVGLKAEADTDGVYKLFSADQIIEMTQSSDPITGAFKLISDIDMRGAELSPVAKLTGNITGTGLETISNYTITSMADNNAAFFAEVTGTITGVVFAGDVIVDVSAKTSNEYYIAGIAAKNNGQIVNCKFIGNITATNTSLAGYNTMFVGGLAATETGVITGSVSEGATITAIAKFDILGAKIFVGAQSSKVVGTGTLNTVKVSCTYGAKETPVIGTFTIAE